MVRRAYSDEVPQKMHDGPNAIGDDGTPRMAAKAVGYIFGPEDRNDAGRNVETGQRDLIGWYYAPFRALLRKWSGGNDAARKRAAIVRHVAIGSQEGVSAAITEGVPSWCAYLVAEHTLREFCRNLTDFNLHPPKEQNTVV